jgi:probable addiction module antidote protein
MPKRARPYRESLLEDLQSPIEAADYLNAALEDSDEMFLVALRDVAEAKHMAKVAVQVGVARETLYRMLSKRGNPTYSNLTGLLDALGMRMRLEPLSKGAPPGSFDSPDAKRLKCADSSRETSNKDRDFNAMDSEPVGYWRGDTIAVGGGAIRGNRKKPMKRVIVSRERSTRDTHTVNSPKIVAGGIIVSRAA